MAEKINAQLATRVSVWSIIVNCILVAVKAAAGFLSGSSALVSDAVHSLSDVLSTFIVIIGVRMAGKQSDSDHPYGHERFECVAAILLAVLLGLTGAGIGWAGLQKIGSAETLAVPGMIALVAALLSIALKEGMYRVTIAVSRKIRSGALAADAWHHRSDALSSVGSFIGILGARMGFPVLDPVASVVICLFIFKAAYDIFMDAIHKMTDTACDSETSGKMHDLILGQPGVMGVDTLKTRLFGDKIYVDVEICADGNLPLFDSHKIAEDVHDAIEHAFPDVKHCMVHVNPYEG